MSNKKRWLENLAEIEKPMFELGAEMEYHGGFGICGDAGRLLLILSRDVQYISQRIKRNEPEGSNQNLEKLKRD